jgi:uncharacterized membrane protein
LLWGLVVGNRLLGSLYRVIHQVSLNFSFSLNLGLTRFSDLAFALKLRKVPVLERLHESVLLGDWFDAFVRALKLDLLGCVNHSSTADRA